MFSERHEPVFFLQQTLDRTCILDRHPQFKNIILGVGFSGRYDQAIRMFQLLTSVHS